jgi:hypothetical protein
VLDYSKETQPVESEAQEPAATVELGSQESEELVLGETRPVGLEAQAIVAME